MLRLLCLSLFVFSCASATAAPVELGDVKWREFDAGLREARQSGKPLLVLFNEVPGCATVRGFGEGALRHPLIVEAAEDLFVPVLVKNNVGGRDREILERFGEPTWNNPVVRIIDVDGKALAPRFAGEYTSAGLAENMRVSLGDRSPAWLELVVEGRAVEQATFSMYCFWTGEVALGELEGVIWTRPGFLDGHEVVELAFDPSRISYRALVEHALRNKVADRVYTHSASQQQIAGELVGERALVAPGPIRYSAKDDNHQLRGVKSAMSEPQITKVNAWVGRGRDPAPWLSPRQQAHARRSAKQ